MSKYSENAESKTTYDNSGYRLYSNYLNKHKEHIQKYIYENNLHNIVEIRDLAYAKDNTFVKECFGLWYFPNVKNNVKLMNFTETLLK